MEETAEAAAAADAAEAAAAAALLKEQQRATEEAAKAVADSKAASGVEEPSDFMKQMQARQDEFMRQQQLHEANAEKLQQEMEQRTVFLDNAVKSIQETQTKLHANFSALSASVDKQLGDVSAAITALMARMDTLAQQGTAQQQQQQFQQQQQQQQQAQPQQQAATTDAADSGARGQGSSSRDRNRSVDPWGDADQFHDPSRRLPVQEKLPRKPAIEKQAPPSPHLSLYSPAKLVLRWG